MVYDDYFTKEKIIDLISVLRVGDAFKHHQKYFFNDLEHLSEIKTEIYKYTPPRRLWVKPNRINRESLGATQLNIWSIKRTFNKYKDSNSDWNIELNKLIEAIQTKAFTTQHIEYPKISFLPKDETTWRPLTLYQLTDHIYICLLAKYLTDLKDIKFQDSSIAFRSKEYQKKTGIKTYHQIIQKLIDYRKLHSTVYVAECDIKAFYDTVPHTKLSEMIESDEDLDLRARNAILNYLESYTFHDVIQEAHIKKKKIKYPEEAISKDSDIGLPQGGAISCWLSNYYLDSIDESLNKETTENDLYFRYCDDIILLSNNKKRITKLFSMYMKGVAGKQLYYHKPISVDYSSKWYDVKSKAPYSWSIRYPYISFLGYQIKYNGEVRIRKKSIEKEKTQQKEFIDRAIKVYTEAAHTPKRRKFLIKIKSKLFKRIIGLSYSDFNKKKTFAWSTGFKVLRTNNFNTTQIKELDRNLARETKRLKEAIGIKYLKDNKYKFEYIGSYYSGFKK